MRISIGSQSPVAQLICCHRDRILMTMNGSRVNDGWWQIDVDKLSQEFKLASGNSLYMSNFPLNHKEAEDL